MKNNLKKTQDCEGNQFDNNSYLTGSSAHCPPPHSSIVEIKFAAIKNTNKKLAVLLKIGKEENSLNLCANSPKIITNATAKIQRTEIMKAQV